MQEGYAPETVMLCVAYVASRGKRTMAAVLHELKVWRAEGVETGEQADAHLKLLALRQTREQYVASLLGIPDSELTLGGRKAKMCIRDRLGDGRVDVAVVVEDGQPCAHAVGDFLDVSGVDLMVVQLVDDVLPHATVIHLSLIHILDTRSTPLRTPAKMMERVKTVKMAKQISADGPLEMKAEK